MNIKLPTKTIWRIAAVAVCGTLIGAAVGYVVSGGQLNGAIEGAVAGMLGASLSDKDYISTLKAWQRTRIGPLRGCVRSRLFMKSAVFGLVSWVAGKGAPSFFNDIASTLTGHSVTAFAPSYSPAAITSALVCSMLFSGVYRKGTLDPAPGS